MVTLADRPALIDRTMTLWSKVFSRPFLTGLGMTLPPGIHEDVPMSAGALLFTHRIALPDRVCYLYRRRPGSFLDTPGIDHFRLFSAYAEVFALPDEGAGAAPAVRAAVFGRAIEHYSSIPAAVLPPVPFPCGTWPSCRQITRRSRRVFAAVTVQSGDEGVMRKCGTSSGSFWP